MACKTHLLQGLWSIGWGKILLHALFYRVCCRILQRAGVRPRLHVVDVLWQEKQPGLFKNIVEPSSDGSISSEYPTLCVLPASSPLDLEGLLKAKSGPLVCLTLFSWRP